MCAGSNANWENCVKIFVLRILCKKFFRSTKILLTFNYLLRIFKLFCVFNFVLFFVSTKILITKISRFNVFPAATAAQRFWWEAFGMCYCGKIWWEGISELVKQLS